MYVVLVELASFGEIDLSSFRGAKGAAKSNPQRPLAAATLRSRGDATRRLKCALSLHLAERAKATQAAGEAGRNCLSMPLYDLAMRQSGLDLVQSSGRNRRRDDDAFHAPKPPKIRNRLDGIPVIPGELPAFNMLKEIIPQKRSQVIGAARSLLVQRPKLDFLRVLDKHPVI